MLSYGSLGSTKVLTCTVSASGMNDLVMASENFPMVANFNSEVAARRRNRDCTLILLRAIMSRDHREDREARTLPVVLL